MNAFALAALLAVPVPAQDELPKLPEELPGVKPAAEAPAEPAKQASGPEAACLLSGPAAEGKGCASAYRELADGYLSAYKAMDAWLAAASAEVQGALEKVEGLEKAFTDNESKMTALKLDRSKDAKAKLRDLGVENKRIWRDLQAARKDQDKVCKGFQRSAAAKVKELAAELSQRLSTAQKAGL